LRGRGDLVREAERRFDGLFPQIVRCNALGFQCLHKRAHCGSGGIRNSVISGNAVAHGIHERTQRLDRFGGGKASSPVKDIKDIAD
jgi:hypothetical protein